MILRNDHFFLKSAPEMREISKPLLSLGITYFSYGRHYNNGGRLWLCNTPENVESYYRRGLYRFGNSESHPKNYHSQVVLWSTLPNQLVFNNARQFGIDHGIFIIEPQQDYCEFLAFGTTPNNHRIINTYLTNIDYLKKFGDFFKDNGQSLIKHGEINKVILPYHNKEIMHVSNMALSPLFENRSLSLPKLSRRQYSCAQLFLQGKTTKEIAKEFCLSPRTIETYIDNLKSKFGCQNRIELALKLSEYMEKGGENDSKQ